MSTPLADFRFGISDKTIRAALCTGGRVRTERLLRQTDAKRFTPTLMPTYRFGFAPEERAFHIMRNKIGPYDKSIDYVLNGKLIHLL